MLTAIFLWFSLSVLAGYIANNKGNSFISYFLLSILLSPLIGLIASIVSNTNTQSIEQEKLNTGESKRCPYCAELVKAQALICKHCGKDVEDVKAKPTHQEIFTAPKKELTEEDIIRQKRNKRNGYLILAIIIILCLIALLIEVDIINL